MNEQGDGSDGVSHPDEFERRPPRPRVYPELGVQEVVRRRGPVQ